MTNQHQVARQRGLARALLTDPRLATHATSATVVGIARGVDTHCSALPERRLTDRYATPQRAQLVGSTGISARAAVRRIATGAHASPSAVELAESATVHAVQAWNRCRRPPRPVDDRKARPRGRVDIHAGVRGRAAHASALDADRTVGARNIARSAVLVVSGQIHASRATLGQTGAALRADNGARTRADPYERQEGGHVPCAHRSSPCPAEGASVRRTTTNSTRRLTRYDSSSCPWARGRVSP